MNDIINTKQCPKCSEIKNIDNFNKDKNQKDGYYRICKDCRSKQKSIYLPDTNLKEKKCYQCHIIKSIDSFHKSKYTKNGYNTWCKNCFNIYRTDNLYQRFKSWEHRAKQRNISFEISFQDLKSLPLICYYTKKKLTLERYLPNTISLDRIDNNVGYVKNNIVFCCSSINYMKQQMRYDEFIDSCKLILQTHNERKNISLVLPM